MKLLSSYLAKTFTFFHLLLLLNYKKIIVIRKVSIGWKLKSPICSYLKVNMIFFFLYTWLISCILSNSSKYEEENGGLSIEMLPTSHALLGKTNNWVKICVIDVMRHFFSLTTNQRHCKGFISFVTGQQWWRHVSCVGTDFMNQYLQCLSFLKLFWLFCHKCICYTLIGYSPKYCSKFLHFFKKNVNTCLVMKESIVKSLQWLFYLCNLSVLLLTELLLNDKKPHYLGTVEGCIQSFYLL